MDCLLFGTTVK
uniref:REC114 meiotic recombination protein n=2 Tax=Glires TaxID=314147 RepID=A0A8C6RYE7_NANGA